MTRKANMLAAHSPDRSGVRAGNQPGTLLPTSKRGDFARSPCPLTTPEPPNTVDILSRLLFPGQQDAPPPNAENPANVYPLLQRVSDLSAAELADFLCLADAHHVTVRALEALGKVCVRVSGP